MKKKYFIHKKQFSAKYSPNVGLNPVASASEVISAFYNGGQLKTIYILNKKKSTNQNETKSKSL